jgi:hypothetical protein
LRKSRIRVSFIDEYCGKIDKQVCASPSPLATTLDVTSLKERIVEEEHTATENVISPSRGVNKLLSRKIKQLSRVLSEGIKAPVIRGYSLTFPGTWKSEQMLPEQKIIRPLVLNLARTPECSARFEALFQKFLGVRID